MFIGIIVGFILIGTKDFNKEVEVDNEKFDQDYANVNKDNVFKYVNAVEIATNLKKVLLFLWGIPKTLGVAIMPIF